LADTALGVCAAIGRPLGVAANPATRDDPAAAGRRRHGTRTGPVRGYVAGAQPTTACEAVDPPRIGGEFPDATTQAGQHGP
jgi:hypothetical protein